MSENKDDIRNELLIKVEQSKSFLFLNNNYNKLIDIITESRWEYLFYMRRGLLKMINILSDACQSADGGKSEIGYRRYKYTSKLVDIRLNMLSRKMRHKSVETYMHQYAGMSYLWLSKGYNPENIECLIDARQGKPDYFTTIDRQGHEIKFLEGNRIFFTPLQFVNFEEDVNIVIFERVRHDIYVHELMNIGYEYRKTIKFGDILNRKCRYKIDVKDSDFEGAIRERYRVLNDRRRQMNIEDAWGI